MITENPKNKLHKIIFILFLTSVLLIFAGIGVVYIHLTRKIERQELMNIHIKKEIKLMEQRVAHLQVIAEDKKKLLTRIDVFTKWQANQLQAVRLFEEIARIVPTKVYLTCLTRNQNKLFIEGKAESNALVSIMMRNMQASNRFKNPEITVIQNESGQPSEVVNATKDTGISFNLHALENE
ncbi:MAG: PilN domain-containing protein [Candidatus Berkiellales bacterium]